MGWSGGGLGKMEQGILEPISVSTLTIKMNGKRLRQGLGASLSNDYRIPFTNIQEYEDAVDSYIPKQKEITRINKMQMHLIL